MTLSQLKSIFTEYQSERSKQNKEVLKKALLEFGKFTKRQRQAVNFKNFGFVQREKKSNTVVKNRCLRDFLYYVLHYYFPEIFNPDFITPQIIEDVRLFGFKIPKFLPAAGAQYSGIAKLFNAFHLKLEFNGKRISNKRDFLRHFIFRRNISYDNLIKLIQYYLKNNIACGIDLPIKILLDHVIFICGIDNNNLYLIDTYQTKRIKYKKMSKNKNQFLMVYKLLDLKEVWDFRGLVWAIF